MMFPIISVFKITIIVLFVLHTSSATRLGHSLLIFSSNS
uniref:Uncharacterized protein n=1 Tax=Microplitis mediator bracovirus TaxID=1836595 RepID=A0A2I6SGW3_9VIRU|nr:hypothetical protein MmBV_SMP9 [Microplitis mediator bracovirus]